MSQILDNTGIKVWSTADYTQYFTDFIQELAGTTSTSNMKLLDDAIGVLQRQANPNIADTMAANIATNTTNISTLNENLALKTNTADIQNVLTSTDTTKPLSAAQGKVLKDLADDNGFSVVDGKLCMTYEREE